MLLPLKRFLLLIMISTLSLTLLEADGNPFESKLPFKEGIVHYKITGSKQGTQTTYIRDFGKERLIYKNSHSKIMHTSKKDDDIIMITPAWTYHINLLTNEATKEPSLNNILIKKFNQLTKKEQKKILAKKTTTLLNFPAITYSINGITTTMTKSGNLLLNSQSSIMGYKVKTMVTDIEIKDVNASLFHLPKGVKITEKSADETKAKEIITALLKEDTSDIKKAKVDYQMIIQEGIHSLEF